MINLTKEKILSIPEELKTKTQRALAKEWGVHYNTISYWVKQLRQRGTEIPRKDVSILDK